MKFSDSNLHMPPIEEKGVFGMLGPPNHTKRLADETRLMEVRGILLYGDFLASQRGDKGKLGYFLRC